MDFTQGPKVRFLSDIVVVEAILASLPVVCV